MSFRSTVSIKNAIYVRRSVPLPGKLNNSTTEAHALVNTVRRGPETRRICMHSIDDVPTGTENQGNLGKTEKHVTIRANLANF